MNIFVFEPRINLVIAWLCFCAACALTGCVVSWMTNTSVRKSLVDAA